MMTIELWNVIVSAGTEVRRLLDRALPQTYVAATAQETTMMLNAGTDVIGILRTELSDDIAESGSPWLDECHIIWTDWRV